MSKTLCHKRQLPCPSPQLCATDCHFNAAGNTRHLANLRSCHDMGVCLARNPPCRGECQEAARAKAMDALATAMNAPIAPKPTLNPHLSAKPAADDMPLVHAEDCQRFCVIVFCIALFVLVAVGGFIVLRYYDAPLRAAMATVGRHILALANAAATLLF